MRDASCRLALAACLAVAFFLAPSASANCALIPTALAEIPSEDGSVDRPFAGPGDVVTVISASSCKPGPDEPHFDPDPANNQITLVFEPPGGAVAPAVPAVTASAVFDCGDDRCFALEFTMPDTTGLAGPYPLTGPARIQVTNLAAGVPVAEIGALFQRAIGCNGQNRALHLFERFTVLPPPNSYDGATSTLLATVDGSGAMLIPMTFANVLAVPVANDAAVRLLTVDIGDFPNGLATGNGIPGPDGGQVRIPRQSGRFLRSFSTGGRPIPPLLKVTATTPLARASDGLTFGDQILGSVDFVASVIRIARSEVNPLDPAQAVQLFAIPQEAGAPAGLALRDGVGPVELAGATLSAGAAAPLNSLNASEELAVVARSESLANPATPSEDLVVEFVALDDGNNVDTAMSVVETARSPRKPVIATAGSTVVFLQSEVDQFFDFNGDGNLADHVFRAWTADGSHPACGGAPCELTAGLGAPISADASLAIAGPAPPGPVQVTGGADPGRFAFFAASESKALPATSERISLDFLVGETTRPSFDPSMSGDAEYVAFTSRDPALEGAPPTDTVTFDAIASGTGLDTSTTLTEGDYEFTQDRTLAPGSVEGSPEFIDVGGGEIAIVDSIVEGALLGQQILFRRIDGGTFTFESVEAQNLLAGSDPTPRLQVLGFVGGVGGTQVGLEQYVTAGVQTHAAVALAGQQIDALVVSHINLSNGSTQGIPNSNVVIRSVTMGAPQQVHRRQRVGASNALVSASTGAEPGNGPSAWATLSGDGRHVSFESDASDLVAGDTEGQRDVMLRDMDTSTTTRISETGGVGGNGASTRADLSDDGGSVAYESLASNLVAGDTNGVSDVFVRDDGGANERASVRNAGGQANGASSAAAVSGDGNEVAFQSDASNLVAGDTNGLTDVFLRDRAAGTTERISVGYGGAQPDGASLRPRVSADGRYVVFESDATNLVPPGTVLNGPHQCYVRDRLKGSTELVSATIADESADAPCLHPFLSTSGRFVSFASSATNLGLAPPTTAIQRIYLFDRLTGDVLIVAGGSGGATGLRSSGAEGPRGGVVFDTPGDDPQPGIDLNGVSDVYGAVLDDAASAGLNTSGPAIFQDTDNEDAVLHVFDADGPSLTNTQIPVTQVAVAGGRAAIVPDPVGLLGQIWDAEGGNVRRPMNVRPSDVAISELVFCALDEFGELSVGPPTSGVSTSTGVAVLAGLQAVGDRCAFRDATGQLGFSEGAVAPTLTTAIASAADFQVAPDGIAFRTCESDTAPPADLNGDTDTSDCVMRFWDFTAAAIVETGHTAERCTFPGCDPFFLPYKPGPGIISFVTFESREMDSGGSGAIGTSCLSTSTGGVCDKTGDRDGDDAAIEIYSLLTGRAQVFPLDVELPPEVVPFPTVTQGDTGNVMTIQLPAEVLGPEFAALPPDRLVTVIVGDAEGDGVFETDGNLDPQLAVRDRCVEAFDPDQTDLDRDGMAAACDVELSSGLPNDDPVTSPPSGAAQIPGSDKTQLCNLNAIQNPADVTITRAEVDQIWADRGTPISAPADLDGAPPLDATDLRDKDADGAVTAVDFSLCLAACDAQAGGCPAAEADSTPQGYKACGLLGLEALLLLVPWIRWRRRSCR